MRGRCVSRSLRSGGKRWGHLLGRKATAGFGITKDFLSGRREDATLM